MTEQDASDRGWFVGIDPGDSDAAAGAVRDGSAETVEAWPQVAVEAGAFDSAEEYYDRLHGATMAATRAAVREAETAADKQLIHAVRAIDNMARKLV